MEFPGLHSFIVTRFLKYDFFKWYTRQLDGDRAARLLAVNHIVVDSLTKEDKKLLEARAGERYAYTFIVQDKADLEAAGLAMDKFLEQFNTWKLEMRSKGYNV